jgi:hypothetical protein
MPTSRVGLESWIYQHRKHWPSLLFHHAPIENALRIINSGQLLSRNGSNGVRARDVAAPGVIDNRDRAHDFVRLYFRPRTPTQFNIEGIRRPADCRYENAHAPILVMFALDARSILSIPDVRFSNINMQLDAARDGDDEAFFTGIEFAKVYHEGTYSDPSIKDHRCAEVLCPSPLAIAQHLRWIICRSDAERQSLAWQAGPAMLAFRDRVIASDDLRVFDKNFAFTNRVNVSNEGVTFTLNPRRDGQRLKVRVEVTSVDRRPVFDVTYPDMPALSNTGGPWIARMPLIDGTYVVSLTIDDHLAYQSGHHVGEVLF